MLKTFALRTLASLIASVTVMSLLLIGCLRSEPSTSLTTSAEVSPVLGGESVAASDPLATRTVLIISYQVNTQRDGNQHVLESGRCTGSLIDDGIILTAAHCASGNRETWAYFSAEAPRNSQELFASARHNPKMRLVTAKAVTQASMELSKPGHNAELEPWADVALFKFEGGTPAGFQRASLLPLGARLSKESILVAGFGIADARTQTLSATLQKISLMILDPDKKPGEFLVDTSLQQGVCRGDSGGPAYVQRNGQWLLAGLVSHPELKPGPTSPLCAGRTLFTNLSVYQNWIAANVQFLKNNSGQGIIAR